MHTVKTYGPPGTGKTTRLIKRVTEELERGTPLSRICYLSFSVAAKEVIKERLNANEQDVRWFRTIHGAAAKHLGLGGSIINWTHYKEFHRATGMKITPEDFDEEVERKDMDFNIALRALNLSATMMKSPREIIRTLPDHPALEQKRFNAFVEAWTKFKADAHLFDFTDMLVNYARDGEPLPIDVGILDEGQDCSPLQWVCFEKMIQNAQRCYMAGDDDQAIYTFLGASEYGFLEHGCDEEEVLSKSYRVPHVIGAQADRIISRVSHRKEKAVEWRAEPGVVSRINQDAMGMHWKQWHKEYEDIMVLCRHRRGAMRFSDDLKAVGVPHSLNGETMNSWPEAKVLHSLYALKDGKTITPKAAIALADALGRDSADFRKLGRRERVKEIPGVNVTTLDWLTQFSTSKRSRLRYHSLQRLVRQEGYEALAADPKVKVSTMHASKGKEADLIVILPDCTNVVKRNVMTPTEIRLSYVALTRAKKEAALVIPRTDTYIQHFFY